MLVTRYLGRLTDRKNSSTVIAELIIVRLKYNHSIKSLSSAN